MSWSCTEQDGEGVGSEVPDREVVVAVAAHLQLRAQVGRRERRHRFPLPDPIERDRLPTPLTVRPVRCPFSSDEARFSDIRVRR
jgi:hypothetical protein